MLVDVHCHLDFEDFEKDLPEVIKRAKKEGFKTIISNGTNLERNKKVLEISRKYPIVKPAFGLYPVEAETISTKDLKEVLKFIENNGPVAIGEVGLDLHHGKKIEKQKQVLKQMIALSKKLNIPIIVHSRKAEEETVKFLEENNARKVIMHCFGGNKELTERAANNGWMFSIPTSIVRNKSFKKLAKRVPLSQLLTETDAPFLSPYEGKRNEPAFIKETIRKLSETLSETQEKVEKTIYENYKEMFKQ